MCDIIYISTFSTLIDDIEATFSTTLSELPKTFQLLFFELFSVGPAMNLRYIHTFS